MKTNGRPSDSSDGLLGRLLDGVARAVFDTDAPSRSERLMPLLAHYDAQVGPLLDEDPARALLLAMRLDWALCDAPCHDARDDADTWLRRAIAAEVPGIDTDAAWQTLLASHAGLFEVWPTGDGAFLRDVVHGACITVLESLALAPERRGPAALWDVRVVVQADGTGVLCRAPLAYPLDALPVIEDVVSRVFGAAAPTLLPIRRAWLACQRQPRLQPRRAFARALGSSV